jgi:pyrroline-5-carboxylate reductase
MSDATPILLVGCGKMGSAMLAGWRAQGIAADDVVVVEPAEALAADLAERHGVRVVGGASESPEGFMPATVIFAVKPQMMDVAAPDYADFIRGGALALSIAAGKDLRYFEELFGETSAIVRTMSPTSRSRLPSPCCRPSGKLCGSTMRNRWTL